jgi:sugar/nucleoside kinase (ribokinase family)
MKVGVVGAATRDRIEIGDRPSRSQPGGTPLDAARALLSVGAEPCAVEVGMLDSLIAHDPDGTRQEILSLPPPLTPQRLREQVLPVLAGCAWVLLGGQTAGDFPTATIAALVAAGHRVCLDGQGLARGSRTGPVRLGAISQSGIAGVTALKLNQAEAAAAGSLDVPELLVTRGERGVTVAWSGGRQEIAGDGGRFADPTGAGDSFAALYCVARSDEATPPDAARFALDAVQRLYEGER